MKRYIIYLVTTIFIGHLSVAAILSYRYWVARDLSDVDPSINQVTKFQEQKIQAMKPGDIDTVFLGDSTLGNALNAQLFDKLVGTRSLNLALTGSHGHAGALIFLREIAARQPALRNVILFFSVDGMAYGLNKEGRFYMSAWPIEPEFSCTEQVALLGTYAFKLTEGAPAFAYLKKIFNGHAEVELPPSVFSDDYIISRSKIAANSEYIRNYRMPKEVSPKSTRYLAAIDGLCKQLHLHCVYVQGPIVAEIMTGSADQNRYLSGVAAALGATGITLANDRPFPMSEKERGDSIFHLSHDSRDEWTARYAKLIAPMLNVSSK